MSVLPTDTENEKDQCGTRVERIGRLAGAAAAPLGVRPRGILSSAAAQPARREAGASLFDFAARTRYMPFPLWHTKSGAAPGFPRRAAPGRKQHKGSRGPGA